MIVETRNLTKQFKGKGGCKDISLSVNEGRIFGFLGPNGAGKSTFVKTLLGLLQPTSGEAFIMDKPLGDVNVRKGIGYLPELFRYHDWLTGEELLKYHAQLFGLTKMEYTKKISEVLEIVGLLGKEKQKVGTFSKGMQQRIGLAVALINDPKLLFLDEPTSALDPIGRKEVRDIILELKGKGKTIFLNSHLLSEVEIICDEIAIINNGKLIVNGSWQELQIGKTQLEIQVENFSEHIKERLLAANFNLEAAQSDKYLFNLNNKQEINEILYIFLESEGLITQINTKRKSLEDLFIYWINQEGRDNANTN